jgi:hypothetical protein
MAQVVKSLAANDVDEEINSRIQIGHGETDVVGATQSRQAFGVRSHGRTPYHAERPTLRNICS